METLSAEVWGLLAVGPIDQELELAIGGARGFFSETFKRF